MHARLPSTLQVVSVPTAPAMSRIIRPTLCNLTIQSQTVAAGVGGGTRFIKIIVPCGIQNDQFSYVATHFILLDCQSPDLALIFPDPGVAASPGSLESKLELPLCPVVLYAAHIIPSTPSVIDSHLDCFISDVICLLMVNSVFSKWFNLEAPHWSITLVVGLYWDFDCFVAM